MHDLIFERYPEQYKKLDVLIYRRKFKHACTHADRIIAISKQTADDLVALYGVNRDKIDICYQSCHTAFSENIPAVEVEGLRKSLGLPPQFFLYVGSIIERKNLLLICQALASLRTSLPLVVIGSGRSYKQKVVDYIRSKGMEQQVIFLSQRPDFASAVQTPAAMARIYKMATAMIYPSIYEGFGIPVLEALAAGVPVITSNISCLPETGGDAALYIDPFRVEDLAGAMQRIMDDEALRTDLIQKGLQQAARFNLKDCSAAVMSVYQKLLS
jgi:glycosyltransferase involved in cell wall biosynthesis